MASVLRQPCPLCAAEASAWWTSFQGPEPRTYYHCAGCDLRFVGREFRLPYEEELARYQEHRNDPRDPEYRNFLRPAFEAVASRLAPGAEGLDFGAGPGPALVEMLREAGYEAHPFDPIFHPRAARLTERYDFITCTETAEHFHDPAAEFARLDELLRPGGYLVLQSGRLADWEEFPRWHYHRDPTHVCFFSESALHWIARTRNWNVTFPAPHLAVFHKP